MKTTYTKEEDNFLRENISKYSWEETTKRLNDKFGTKRNHRTVKTHCRRTLKCISGRPGQFQKGVAHGMVYSIGDEVVGKNGYTMVKVNDFMGFKGSHKAYRENWKEKHIIIWEKSYGKIPENSQIIFLDGNKSNFNIKNLLCVSNKIMAIMNYNKWFNGIPEFVLTAIKYCELYFAIKEAN